MLFLLSQQIGQDKVGACGDGSSLATGFDKDGLLVSAI
jgi:hypothetical protein